IAALAARGDLDRLLLPARAERRGPAPVGRAKNAGALRGRQAVAAGIEVDNMATAAARVRQGAEAPDRRARDSCGCCNGGDHPRKIRRRSTICHMAATDDRETESGIELKPVYTADDAPHELEPPGEYPFTRGPYPDMYRGR